MSILPLNERKTAVFDVMCQPGILRYLVIPIYSLTPLPPFNAHGLTGFTMNQWDIFLNYIVWKNAVMLYDNKRNFSKNAEVV